MQLCTLQWIVRFSVMLRGKLVVLKAPGKGACCQLGKGDGDRVDRSVRKLGQLVVRLVWLYFHVDGIYDVMAGVRIDRT